ncbi:glycerol-3-phosphate dehydrogenase [Sporosarcina sp. P37]|uniref:glycerol-3-phosphate dehydrogenase/oxidase n=1 Tax=unclassified Sporosarcina TaxID=2647733 RepID=UPI000A17C7F3|nr:MULTISPECIES: glycerol-3-phosphate dehydrogenase/oxidase [unclassified Sporosarcina]ARK25841.1 glycerol-3-phosphate dehydrogenase [Sporosarcina sp. P37]PID19135.1 glycerol-3-phosphate dehydrogenase/oxidase [Sporosarcina sp. P35]
MFSTVERANKIQDLKQFSFDVLVVGGGITGAGIALDAAARGFSVALVDMQDFAAGTSSRSTKLVHGGLRYLKQLEVKIVAETGKEREIVFRNSRNITKSRPMLLPIYKKGTYGKYSTSAGLLVYDLLAGVKHNERREMLTKEETSALEPLLKKKQLKGGGYYVEYQTDDARLTIEVLKKAAEKGALCVNYMKCEQFNFENERIVGAVLSDQLSSERFSVAASMVVNASGPWVDDLQKKVISKQDKQLHITKGVHIVTDQSVFPLRQAVYFDNSDGRMLFAIPRDNKTYVGTTDTFYSEDKQHPVATEDDIHYIINAVNEIFPSVRLQRHQVESTWAGIRPLIAQEGKDASEISRKDEIWETVPGLLTIAGGKLTGYRQMAEVVVDRITKRLKKPSIKQCQTKNIPVSGSDFADDAALEEFINVQAVRAPQFGLTPQQGARIASFYGRNSERVFQFAHSISTEENPLPISLRAEILYGIHYEMVTSPSDFFIRRKGDLYFQIDTVESLAKQVTEYMAALLDYTDNEKAVHENDLMNAVAEAKGRAVS